MDVEIRHLAGATGPSNSERAERLMRGFAERTGLASDNPPRRYLWTDAYAVCNFFALADALQEARLEALAFELIDQVHRTLGRHRPDDSRSGWLSGLGEEEGRRHPTRGGLRIGKELPERRTSEPFDEALEWRRDGQYFHYLTRWMHALDVASRRTPDGVRFNLWARELAFVAYRAFAHPTWRGGPLRMAWKMSIDLSRPQVDSMGQHDPLDGLITCVGLQDTAARLDGAAPQPDLEREVAGFSSMVQLGHLGTGDPLGIGGLLFDMCRVAQLVERGGPLDSTLLESLAEAAVQGLCAYLATGALDRPARERLAFRELGLAIGLQALEQLDLANNLDRFQPARVRDLVNELARHYPVGQRIISTWLQPSHQTTSSWTGHLDINEVMLATSLLPDGLVDR